MPDNDDRDTQVNSGPCEGTHLLVRHRTGDGEAFLELIQLYRSAVFSYLCRCGISPRDRDDLFQEVFIKLHGNAERFDAARPFRPWLFSIVTNTVRSHFRKERTKRFWALLQSRRGESHSVSAHEHSEARETVAWLERAMTKLPLAQREALAMVSLRNIPHEEAAEALGIPVATLRTHLRRARLALAKALIRRKQREIREVEQ